MRQSRKVTDTHKIPIKVSTWTAKLPRNCQVPDAILPALSPVWKLPPHAIPGWLPISGYLSLSKHYPSVLCQTVSTCHLLPGWGISWDAESWMLKEALTTALSLNISKCTNNWKKDKWAQDPFGLIQHSYSYTFTSAFICFLAGYTSRDSQLKFHTVWSFVCYDITCSVPVGTLQLSCSNFSHVKVSLYWKYPLPFFADPLYCSPAAWEV